MNTLAGRCIHKHCIWQVRELRKTYPHLDIGVDGGVGLSTIQHCADAGMFSVEWIFTLCNGASVSKTA